MQGTHVIIDISDITNNDILKYENTIIELMDKIVEEFQLNVVNKVMHQFTPFGVTGVYVLSESHLSIHTFVEERKIAMDLYTCTKFTRTKELLEFIHLYFDDCHINHNIIDRC